MRQVVLFLWVGWLLFALTGCAGGGYRGESSLDRPGDTILHLAGNSRLDAEQKVPQGMRLGAPYISALGEHCYEVVAEQTSAPAGQALCLRQANWELLTPIYMNIPLENAQVAKRP